LKLAENGEVDGLYAVVPIAEREQFFYLTPPIVQSAYGVFVPARSTLRYSRPHDLDGYTVGAYGPSAASRVLEDVATQASGLKMEIELDNLRLLKMLSSGRYGERAAAIANVDVGMQLVREHHLEGLRVAGLIGHTEYAIGLSRRKVSAERAQAFNAALLRLMRSGEIRRIVERHGLRPAP
jgi:polar amino acid transport system substrate-binding protein